MTPSVFRSLRFRLIASVVVIEIVMLSLLVWSNMGVIQQAYAERLQETAAGLLQQIADTSGSYLLEVDYASLEEYLRNVAGQKELNYLVVSDRDQRSVVSLGKPPLSQWPEPDLHPLRVHDDVLDVARDIRIGEQLMGEVRAGFSLTLMEHAIRQARMRSIAIAATEITLTILATVFIGVHLTRRLGRLAQAAQQVGAGNYSVSVKAETRDEVGMMAMAFNRMVTEVSERTRRLQQALARERVIEETSIDGMITYGVGHKILSLNPAMTALFGFPERELLGEPVEKLLAAPDETGAGTAAGAASAIWDKPTVARTEAVGRRKDGGRFPLELYIGRVDSGGEVLFAATLHDITERKRAERECLTLLEGNRFLIHKSLAVQEEERRHLARELHDELGQCLTAIQADAEIIHELSRTANPKIEASAAAILDVSSRIYSVVHSMMQRLRPSVLDDLGLAAALQEEIEAWQQRHQAVDVRLSIDGDITQLGEAINISLYRVVQESLTNISKHAGATQVDIRLMLDDHDAHRQVVLEITDNGCGIQPVPGNRGLGLIGMRERVEALHGTLAVDSAPAQGVRIRLAIPVPTLQTA